MFITSLKQMTADGWSVPEPCHRAKEEQHRLKYGVWGRYCNETEESAFLNDAILRSVIKAKSKQAMYKGHKQKIKQ
jgi:hypothetical protein